MRKSPALVEDQEISVEEIMRFDTNPQWKANAKPYRQTVLIPNGKEMEEQ